MYRNRSRDLSSVVLFFMLLFISLIAPTSTLIKGIKMDQKCFGYLKQAADANSVELSLERLNIAIDYIETHKLTNGYTSVIYKTEDENIGFWYNNLKTCQKELEEAIDATQLEKTNVLMKIRESLTDNNDEGKTVLTCPKGLSRYPNNLGFGIMNGLSLLIFFFGLTYINLRY